MMRLVIDVVNELLVPHVDNLRQAIQTLADPRSNRVELLEASRVLADCVRQADQLRPRSNT